MAICEICGKTPQFGHNVSHSNRATNRRFDANIKHVRLELNGRKRRLYICTRCLRTLRRST